MLRTVCVPKVDQIVLPIPRSYIGSELEVLVFPLNETTSPQDEQGGAPRNNRGIGCLEGKVWMADDFDAPLEEFKDYM